MSGDHKNVANYSTIRVACARDKVATLSGAGESLVFFAGRGGCVSAQGPPCGKDLIRGLPIETELNAAELWAVVRRETRPRVVPGLQAIAGVLDGVSRAEAARLCGMGPQALRDAAVRFNAEGLDGLVDRPRPERGPRLSEGDHAALAGLILCEPNPERGELSSWPLSDLRQEVEANWGKRFHPASMSRVVHRVGSSRQKARQVHPQSDLQAQGAFAKRAPTRPRRRGHCAPRKADHVLVPG